MFVYISIGNSDDRLTQVEWADFVRRIDSACRHYGPDVHGFWLSASDSRWQNACWCVELNDHDNWSLTDRLDAFKTELGMRAREFKQDSIAWAEVARTEFLRVPDPAT